MRRSPFAILALSACSLGTEPGDGPPRPPDAVDVTIEFCVGDAPLWLAYKNDGYDWVVIPVHVFENSFTFPATPRLTIGTATGVTGSGFAFSDVLIRNLTATEADAIRCPAGSRGLRTMTGTISTDHPANFATVHMGASLAIAIGTRPFTMTGLRTGPLDLVAVDRGDLASENAHPSRVIVRHDIPVVSGGGMPQLDFASSEAKPLDSVRVTLDGGLFAFAQVGYLTVRGTRADLAFGVSSSNTVSIGVVPVSMRAAGDLHRVELFAFDRFITFYQSAPKDTTIAEGPALMAPSFDTVSSSPALRPRLRIGAQPEYPSAIEVQFSQSTESVFRTFSVITTSAYLNGMPAIWELEVPDLSGVSFPSTWALAAGLKTNWAVLGWNARPALFFGGGTPADGESLRAAVRSGQ